jgi:hypothetical protein
MSDSLKIQVIVDGAQVSAGMNNVTATVESATSKIKAAFGSITNAPEGIQNALIVLQNAARMSTGAVNEAAAAIAQLGSSAAKTAPEIAEIEPAANRAAAGVNNARSAFMGLNRELGLGGNRALSTFISQSETLGPLLSKAFTGIAIAGFIQLAVLAGEKLSALIDDTFIFTAAQKDLYAQELGANRAIAQANEQHSQMMRQLAAIGLTPVEQAKLRAQYAKEDADGLANTIAQQEKTIALAQKQLQILQQKKEADTGPQVTGDLGAPFSAEDFDTQIDAQRAKIDGLNATLGQLRAQYRVAGDAIAIAQKQMANDAAKQQIEDLKNLNREIEKEGEETEKAALKRADAERKELEARERLDEATLNATTVVDKTYLEEKQRTAVAATRITEEQGKNELAQIRANAELVEKTTAEQKGVGSSQIKSEAFEAYKQEVAVIQQMIAAEDQLQQKLIVTGAAQDDPKIEESQRRQLALIGEMNKAWDTYATTVHRVTEAWKLEVAQAVKGVGSEFASGVVSWMNHQETFGRAMQKVWTQFADTVVSSLIKAGIQMVINAALQKSLTDGTKLSAAGQAAANTWASVSAIPIVGPFLAPEAAAAAFAGVMAFEKGGMVPGYGPTPAIVHGGEMILNQEQQRALGNGNSSSGGGGHTFHFSPTIHAGGRDLSGTLAKSGKQFIAMAKRELRKMNR